MTDLNLYRAQEGFVNFGLCETKPNRSEAFRMRSPSLNGKGDEENRFGKVAASPNSQNLTERDIKTALVYDWLVTIGGGEKTLEAIYENFPAPIYTLVHHQKAMGKTPFATAEIHPSFLQKIPFATSCYRYLLPFFPLAIEQFNLNDYDLILSTSHAVAKGVLTHPGQLHLCYCLTPMRYAWDLTHHYLQDLGPLQKTLARLALHRLRNWDIASLNRVDHFAAISNYIAKRIKKVYGREAEVIYPPVNVSEIPFQESKEEFYLTISRLVPYKKIDLIVEAFSQTPERRLIVIGDGPEMSKIKQKAGKNIEILGHQTDSVVHDHMKKAKGFIFAAEEDFGIVVVEAQAAGTPVIAFGRGGALETIIEGKTGLFFDAQTIPSLLKTLNGFDRMEFDPHSLRKNAQRFNKTRFQTEFHDFVTRKRKEFHENHHSRRR
ncbi:MAG: glycosyltransferase [Rhabdochlamydiaceae bacterium]|jgi:glycosyltransferase involved in cell wall biosynthesis